MLDRTATDIILRKSPDPHTFIFHERKTSVSKPNHNHVRIAGSSEFSMMASGLHRNVHAHVDELYESGTVHAKMRRRAQKVEVPDEERLCHLERFESYVQRTLIQAQAVVCVASPVLVPSPLQCIRYLPVINYVRCPQAGGEYRDSERAKIREDHLRSVVATLERMQQIGQRQGIQEIETAVRNGEDLEVLVRREEHRIHTDVVAVGAANVHNKGRRSAQDVQAVRPLKPVSGELRKLPRGRRTCAGGMFSRTTARRLGAYWNTSTSISPGPSISVFIVSVRRLGSFLNRPEWNSSPEKLAEEASRSTLRHCAEKRKSGRYTAPVGGLGVHPSRMKDNGEDPARSTHSVTWRAANE
ncbi:hypothetical protein B0H13DRAFT_2272297 [Mycena leptocephala]|nr:hypothetical protein B0H13DRAFT_2272297 [Mycena leptocephala]